MNRTHESNRIDDWNKNVSISICTHKTVGGDTKRKDFFFSGDDGRVI